jgi:hypothetical protein
MRTPAGKECPYYYADFHRGRSVQECRLIDRGPDAGRWKADLCARCPVPGIVMANACTNMVLSAKVRSGFLGLGRRVEVEATCLRTLEAVPEPHIGCGLCHEPLTFLQQPEDEA